MDLRGFATALKLLGIVAVVAVIAIVGQLLGWNESFKSPIRSQVTATPSVSITPTANPTISSPSDIDALSTEADKAIDELNNMQRSLDDLDGSLSTSDIDSGTKELDSIK